MKTTRMAIELNNEFLPVFESLFKQFKVKTKIVKKEKALTKMSQEAFFAKIDKVRKQKGQKISMDEMQKMLLAD